MRNLVATDFSNYRIIGIGLFASSILTRGPVAHAQAELIDERLATKADLERLEAQRASGKPRAQP